MGFEAGLPNMLVARQDSFELGTHDRPVPPPDQPPVGPRFARALHIAQLIGALVAVPAGLGSAYTMYRTNYSPEAACQNLRAGIVAMLDRNVDLGVRRALVRRDVEAFERTCSAADPDATVAFKSLLALDKTPPAVKAAPAAQPPQAAGRKIEATTVAKVETAPASKPEPVPVAKVETAPVAKAEPPPVAKAEPAPAKQLKQPPARATAVASAAPEAPMSDAAWLAAVRSALDNHQERADPPRAAVATPPSTLRPLDEGPAPQALPPQASSAPVLASAPPAAPALPPPVSAMPAPRVEPDHPVPPGAIPDAAAPEPTKKASGMEGLVGDIPFIGKTLADQIR